MIKLNEKDSLLLIIDVQEKLLNAVYNKELLEKKAVIMAKAASILNIPVIVTEQYPNGLGYTIDGIKSALNEDAQTFEKLSFSALDNPKIEKVIKNSEKSQIVIFGIETHICVSQTAIALIDKGYDVTLIKDASGSRAQVEHNAGIERIKENGAHIITTEIALFEWLKSSKNEKFREVQALIK